MNILLVDDEAEILEILKDFLELKEHTVTTAVNGREALELVLAENDFDIAFSDIKMPEMDGLTFLEKVRSNNVNLPVILVSGQGDLESSIRALKLGALDFIVKPVYLKTLDEALRKIENALAAERETVSAQELVKERESQPTYGGKKVSVRFEQTPTLIRFTVSDEGDGFDPAALPDPNNPESWLKLSGRGILFIRSYMDEVHWNDSGNVIAITKYLD